MFDEVATMPSLSCAGLVEEGRGIILLMSVQSVLSSSLRVRF